MSFEKVKELKEYEVIKEERLKDLKSDGCILRHKKSGARICLISNDDDNKVFYIGFRTPAKDSTGVQHIMEHSVLCGSEKYPVKDPFVELVKGSLNTFLNAMTYPDKTVYPVASCNDKDFDNIMDIYLDAVFHPNVHDRPEIFKQEGWHYELKGKDAPLTINGVVYNEMKGAFSSPDDTLDREIFNSLFPDTDYSNESGGDPDVIPSLSYEAFLKFHREFYHPSNSYIYLYGDMDMVSKLEYLDREYLSGYDRIDIDTSIAMQKPFEKPAMLSQKYSVTSEEPVEGNTYLSYNTVIDTSLNRELYLAFQILEYTLLGTPGAVLKQTLLDRGIGKDIQSTYENGILQPYFSVIAKNADASQLDEFKSTIREVLENAVKNGLDKKALRAGINVYEFRYREADFGSYPKGLMYGLQALDSWLYDESEPFMHIEANDTFAFLRDRIETGYFEGLINDYLLDNPHSSIVVLEPERGLTAENDRKLEKKLSEHKASLSDEEIEKLIKDTEDLIKYQEEPNTPEELRCIPLLSISDIRKEALPVEYDKADLNGTTVLTHDIFTNGIGYLTLAFDIGSLPERLIPYLGIFRNVFGYVDTENFGYADLTSEINENSGGIASGANSYTDSSDVTKYKLFYEVRAKVLYDRLPFAFDIISEMIRTSDYSNDKRLLEILYMLKSRLQAAMTSAGHMVAVTRLLSSCSPTLAILEKSNGIEFYRFIDGLINDFDARKETFKKELKEFAMITFRPENLFVDYIADKSQNDLLMELTERFKKDLFTQEVDRSGYKIGTWQCREGYKTSAKVQYVATGGNFIRHGYKYTGALRVLKVIMGYEYLWNNVRVRGGAYGCMNSYSRTGDMFMTSYRDPNLKNTLDVYKGAVDYIRSFDPDERDMTKYIIGTISDMDVPLTPRARGSRSMSIFLSDDSFENLQKERDEVLGATKEDIRKLADCVESVINEGNICVLGEEELIDKESELFDRTESLF
ncbi:MAG: insulinase family protein [Lachnospiraceae bacterium]|nr:insulinase family protein [Lachnospiraceae bacterium]